MIERGEGGSIVNISSIAQTIAMQNHTAYCSSKGAVESLTRVMALELGQHQVIRFDTFVELIFYITKPPSSVCLTDIAVPFDNKNEMLLILECQ